MTQGKSDRLCETCKHWKRHTVDDFGWGWKDERANPDDFGECKAVAFEYWQEKGDKPFYVMDGSEYRAQLNTRRDFGCNQHEDETMQTVRELEAERGMRK